MRTHVCTLHCPIPGLDFATFLPVGFRQEAPGPAPERGDLVKIQVELPDTPTKTYHRQVVSVHPTPEGEPPTMRVLLAPLDLPLMRQVEVTGGDGSTQVIWVASEAPLVPGDLIRDENGNGNLHVSRAFVSLPVRDLPSGVFIVASALLRSSTSE